MRASSATVTVTATPPEHCSQAFVLIWRRPKSPAASSGLRRSRVVQSEFASIVRSLTPPCRLLAGQATCAWVTSVQASSKWAITECPVSTDGAP